jgi:hypothetical protein
MDEVGPIYAYIVAIRVEVISIYQCYFLKDLNKEEEKLYRKVSPLKI